MATQPTKSKRRTRARAVAAYGWTHLDLSHSFHETRQGLRYTLSSPARQEVLDRLLELNHARYAEEVKAGLHMKKTKAPGKSPKPKALKAAPTAQLNFLSDGGEE